MAVSEDSKVIFEKQTLEGPSHATVLAPYVDEALSFIESHAIPLDAVAISSGPGSYTGLRIGTSVAKGVAYGRNVPLIAVPTLKLITVPTLLFDDDMPEDALLVPMIDARRMEVYAAVYDRALRPLREVQPDIVTADILWPNIWLLWQKRLSSMANLKIWPILNLSISRISKPHNPKNFCKHRCSITLN